MISRARARRTAVLALPFLLGPLVLRLAIAPIGDALARSVAELVPRAPSPAAPPPPPPPIDEASPEDELPEATEPFGPPRRVAARAPLPHRATLEESKDAGAKEAGADDRARGTIVVPAAAVARAMEKHDVGAANATAPDGSPLGARLVGVSRYRTGLRDGDIVVSVAGTRTRTVQSMVGAAMRVATGGATRISGRIMRGDATYDVVLELPK